MDVRANRWCAALLPAPAELVYESDVTARSREDADVRYIGPGHGMRILSPVG